MREHIEHTSQAGNAPGTAAEVDLGTTLLLQAAAALEEHVETAAFTLVRRALAIRQNPDPQELAHLTDMLLTHCASLAVGVENIPAEKRPQRGAGALRDWARLQEDGPSDGPLGPWSYARQLALVARNMLQALQALDDRRDGIAARAPYIGRPTLPPAAPSSR
ncbi:DUF6415 family natural product biosynthesis protein [Streptomyces cinereoruber]|uniref:DUF6415 family natural product biosynthesis protein n=1 Tax=Streptomyces cinereoruber TaxID=67260 RepID=UPI00367D516C